MTLLTPASASRGSGIRDGPGWQMGVCSMPKVIAPSQIIDGYVPLIAVDQCPNWAMNMSCNQHGSHKVLENGLCMVLGDGSMGRGIPPGHWIVTYRYNDDEGCHDQDLWIAAKVQ